MNRIKVAHIVPMLGPGGAERVALHIVKGMNRQRYEPIMISLMGRAGGELDRLLDEAEVKVLYLGKHLGFDYRMYSRVYRALQNCHPAIVHTHLQVLRYVFPSIKVCSGISALHTVHNFADREIEQGMRWLQKLALNHGVVPVAVAEEVALSLKRIYGVQGCRVIPNGIPTHSYAHPKSRRSEWRAREGFRKSEVLFVCVARFAPQKNHSLLLNAFAEGPAADRNAHLLLIGDGVLREQLETQVKNLGLCGHVHFLGVRCDIPDILGAADVFALSSDFEGNPLSVMEAMAAGLPIVSTAVGGVPDLLQSGKQGLLVPPGDVHELCKAMLFFHRNQRVRELFGLAAAQRASEKFDDMAMVRSYEEMYEQILERGRPLKSRSSFQEGSSLAR
jgi:glycosyltransferase involved in cell wall biosynthesis